MDEKEKNNFHGFDDSNIEEEQARLVNRDGKYESKHDVRPGESLWDYIKRKEKEEKDSTTL